MSLPKSQLLTEAKIPCITCGRECPDGLRYCLYCGGKTLEIDKPVMPMNPHCPECGEEDALNITFCVACGAKLLSSLETAVTAARFSKKSGFNWTMEVTPPPAVRMAMEVIKQPDKSVAVKSVARPTNLIPVAAGIAAGLIATSALYASGWLPLMFDRATWPKSGLVVYCPVSDLVTGQPDAGAVVDKKDLGVESGKTGAAAPDEKRGGGGSSNNGSFSEGSSKPGASGGAGDSSESGAVGTASTTDAGTDASSASGSPADGTSGDAVIKADTAAKADADTRTDANAKSDASPDEANSRADANTKADGSTKADASTKADGAVETASPATQAAASAPANPGSASVLSGMQISLENLQTHQLVVGPIMPPRTAFGMKMPGCLIMRDLPAGEYMMRIGRDGDTAAFGRVTLVSDKPTAIGYPQGIRLPI